MFSSQVQLATFKNKKNKKIGTGMKTLLMDKLCARIIGHQDINCSHSTLNS